MIALNIRSAHNVGSLLRTADGMGVGKVYLCGYTPFPHRASDPRLPHIAQKVHKQIAKTALGAEKTVAWEHRAEVLPLIHELYNNSYTVCALEQTKLALSLNTFAPPDKVALVVGNEVTGIDEKTLEACAPHLEIPMLGQKESLNVTQATAVALYHIAYNPI